MKKIIFRIKNFFEIPDELPRGEYPEEDRRKEFCSKAKNCSFYGTNKCPLFF